MRLIKLSEKFYSTYANCSELMDKENRPYLFLSVRINEKDFAIPLRHNINHPFCFLTTPPAGLDFSKAVVISDNSYIATDAPRISSIEWQIIIRNEERIIHEFRKYIRRYQRAKRHPNIQRNLLILEYSTLQYFDV